MEELFEAVPLVERVADRFRGWRPARELWKLLVKPGAEVDDQWPAFHLAGYKPLVPALAADAGFDAVEGRDACKRLRRDRHYALLDLVVELAAQMVPTEGERRCGLAGVFDKLLVGTIAVALRDTAIAAEQRAGVVMSATGRVAIDHRGRIGAAPGTIVACDDSEVALLGAATAGIEHWDHGLIGKDTRRSEHVRVQPRDHRRHLGGSVSHPEGQRGASDRHSLARTRWVGAFQGSNRASVSWPAKPESCRHPRITRSR